MENEKDKKGRGIQFFEPPPGIIVERMFEIDLTSPDVRPKKVIYKLTKHGLVPKE